MWRLKKKPCRLKLEQWRFTLGPLKVCQCCRLLSMWWRSWYASHKMSRSRICIKGKSRIGSKTKWKSRSEIAQEPCKAVLRTQIRDPVPFWTLDPGWVKNQDPDLGWTSRIIFSRAFWVKILKFFDADPEIFWTLDPGWKQFGSGIRDKHPGSATLLESDTNLQHWLLLLISGTEHTNQDPHQRKAVSKGNRMPTSGSAEGGAAAISRFWGRRPAFRRGLAAASSVAAAAAAGTGTGLGVFGTANTWSSRSLLLLAATADSALCPPAALRAASASSWIFRLAARFFLSAGRKGSGNNKNHTSTFICS